jgi:hypothetical protein
VKHEIHQKTRNSCLFGNDYHHIIGFFLILVGPQNIPLHPQASMTPALMLAVLLWGWQAQQ